MSNLEQHEVAAYLVERRFVSRRSIVSGRLRIEDASSRNRNFRVSGAPGESYLLKQGIASDSGVTLANEVALYRRLAASASLAACIPRLYGYDAGRGVLIIEWIAGGRDLLALHRARERPSAPLAAAVGRALARVHAVAADEQELRDDPPWVLALHRPRLDTVRYLSAASVELIGAMQADAPLGRALDELREDWRAEGLVHRDLKWANCIAHAPLGGGPRGPGGRAALVKLVDWEMAGWGDPALDVGSAFGDVLGHWIAAGARGAGVRPPADVLHPAAAAFWRAYVRARRLDEGAASALLERSVRYAGARLVQSTYEHTQETPLPPRTDRVAASLGLSRRLLLTPRAAAGEMLGLAA